MATPNSTAQIAELLESVSNWERWGKDDQRGALNYITSEKRVAAAYPAIMQHHDAGVAAVDAVKHPNVY